MKRKTAFLAIMALALIVMGANFALADSASSTGTVNLTAEIASIAELTLGSSTIDFPATSPTTATSVPGSTTTTVTANVRTGGTSATLTAYANADLSADGGKTIPISTVTSTIDASHNFFTTGAVPMTTSSTSPAALGAGGSGSYTGAFTWALLNDSTTWSYKTGNYTATINYTLTAP